LTALALVLIGLSTALYLLARSYLQRQDDERLAATLNTLVAAAEIGSEGVVWDPAERRLNFGGAAPTGQVAWLIADEQGKILDQSKQPEAADFLAAIESQDNPKHGETKRLTRSGQPWQMGRQWIEPPSTGPASESAQPPGPKDEEPKYRSVSIAAAISLAPTQAALRNLATALVSLSLGVWLVALFSGRAGCRPALL